MAKINKKIQFSSEFKDHQNMIFRYQIVDFIEERRGTKKSFDYVPANWIKFDAKIGKCVAKFMESPYSLDDSTLLDVMRKTEADPPESWPSYPVLLRGEADTVVKAIKKAELPNSAEYAYSTDNEDHAKQKSDAVVKIYAAKNKKDSAKTLEAIMSFDDESDSGSVSNNDSNHELSASSNEVPVEEECRRITSSRRKRQSQKLNSQTIKVISSDARPVANLTQKKKLTDAFSMKNRTVVARKDIHEISIDQKDESQPGKSTQNTAAKLVDFTHHTLQHSSTPTTSKQKFDEQFQKFSTETQLLYKAIKSMTVDVQKNSEEIKLLRQAIEGVFKVKISPVTLDTVVGKFGIQLPLKDQSEIQHFNNKLEQDVEFCNQFVNVLHHFVESDLTKPLRLLQKNYSIGYSQWIVQL